MKHLHEQIERYGVMNLSTAELLASLLAGGSNQKPLLVACQLLERYDLKRLRHVDHHELCHEGGLSPTQARRINVLCELARRFAQTEAEEPARITSTQDAVALVRPLMMDLDHEEVRVLTLDRKNHVLANVVLYVGTVDGSVFRVAEIFREAVIRKGSSLIVGHNHPSGDPEPSQRDVEMTKQNWYGQERCWMLRCWIISSLAIPP